MAESEWTDELKDKAAEAYLALEPTPENTMECVKQVAEQLEKTANGTRMILTKKGVYVKKEATKAAAKEGEKKSTRVNKAEAIQTLKDTISASGAEVDDEILDRLTGKAAVYFTSVFAN